MHPESFKSMWVKPVILCDFLFTRAWFHKDTQQKMFSKFLYFPFVIEKSCTKCISYKTANQLRGPSTLNTNKKHLVIFSLFFFSQSTSVDPKVKDQHDSPCEVKSMKEHIHDGHVCSCQKQLQLEKKNGKCCPASRATTKWGGGSGHCKIIEIALGPTEHWWLVLAEHMYLWPMEHYCYCL